MGSAAEQKYERGMPWFRLKCLPQDHILNARFPGGRALLKGCDFFRGWVLAGGNRLVGVNEPLKVVAWLLIPVGFCILMCTMEALYYTVLLPGTELPCHDVLKP